MSDLVRPGGWLRTMAWRHLVGIIMSCFALLPIVAVIAAAVLRPGVGGHSFQALGETEYLTWFGNSLIIASATAIGTVLIGAAAAYAFSRFDFRGRRVSLTAFLVLGMIPQMFAFIGIYVLLSRVESVFPALDPRLALIALYIGGGLAVNTLALYWFFNRVPSSLDEAAVIDGAAHSRIYWTVILRMVAPVLALVALLNFAAAFSEVLLARVILPEPHWTLAVGLSSWVADPMTANWGQFAAGAVLAALPVLALFGALFVALRTRLARALAPALPKPAQPEPALPKPTPAAALMGRTQAADQPAIESPRAPSRL